MAIIDYKSTPQARKLLAHLHRMDPGFDIDIIHPKQRWPNIEKRKSVEVMNIIRQHHQVSKNGLGNDIGFDAFVHRNRDADLWIHILDKKKRIIGFSINEGYEIEGKTINYFRATIFNKAIQKSGIYPLLNELKILIIPSDILMVRTQNPVVYKYFTQLCDNHGLSVSPTVEKIDSDMVKLAKKLDPDVDEFSVHRKIFGGEALIGTPKPPPDIAPIWDRMNIYDGDILVIVGFPK